jgi:predicted CopG family antitoxin
MEEITEALQGTEKIVMLDHDDLYSSLVKMNDSTKFQSYVKKLVDFCKKNNITLLRARGIIFSD